MKKLLVTFLLLTGFVGAVISATVREVQTNYPMDVSRERIAWKKSVNKFGRAVSGVQTTATDIWDRADATPTQQIWTAPTVPQTHYIRSSDAGDDGSPVGVGARTLQVYGLPGWYDKEVSETVVLNGTTNVETTNSYVIIHRMKVLTKGGTSSNVGVIIASGSIDGTVTAEINAGEGQTQMAIYGVPGVQDAYLTQYYASVNKAGGVVGTINFRLLVNPEPHRELTNFLIKHIIGVQSTGGSHFSHSFNPYMKVTGPAIIKINGIGSAADLEGSAGFDLILVDK